MIGLFCLTLFAEPLLGEPVRLIIDTDMGFDVDDVGAVCVANALADRGEADIVAIVHDTGFSKGIGAVSTLVDYYGRSGNITLGAYKGPFGKSVTHGQYTQDRYASDLIGRFSPPVKDYSEVPTALDVYRATLAAQPDRSVRIASIGMTTNLRDLLQSPPDQHSPLSGRDLVAQKVELVVWMNGYYNFGCAEHDGADYLGDDTGCRGSAKAAVSAMPPSVRQIFNGVGGNVGSGGKLTGCAPESDPCRQAYIDWLGEGNDRPSWDPISVVVAVRGADAMFLDEHGQGGHDTVDEAGHESWVAGSASNSTYTVKREGSENAITAALDELLCRRPASLGPAPASTGYYKAKGFNCYGPRAGDPTSHGARDLENPPSSSCGVMSRADCQARCDATEDCDGVVVTPAAGGNVSCYRKADINLAACDNNAAQFETYVKSNWTKAAGFNCYGPRNGAGTWHGAWDLETPSSGSCGTMSLADCQKKCSEMSGCEGITVRKASTAGNQTDGNDLYDCFRKGYVDLGNCDKGTAFDTYVHDGVFYPSA